MKRIYICSPLRGYTGSPAEMEANVERALDHCREAAELGMLPIAPHCYFPRFLDDNVPEERDLGLNLAIELLKLCDEVWVYGIDRPSEGMAAEIEVARALDICVRDAATVYYSAMKAAERSG